MLAFGGIVILRVAAADVLGGDPSPSTHSSPASSVLGASGGRARDNGRVRILVEGDSDSGGSGNHSRRILKEKGGGAVDKGNGGATKKNVHLIDLIAAEKVHEVS